MDHGKEIEKTIRKLQEIDPTKSEKIIALSRYLVAVSQNLGYHKIGVYLSTVSSISDETVKTTYLEAAKKGDFPPIRPPLQARRPDQ